MNILLIIPAVLLGLASSLHCIGMCGPLSLAMPVTGISPRQRFINLLLYQAGRIFTYIAIGALTGLIGRGILLAGYQQLVSVLAGLIILVAAGSYYLGKRAGPLSFLNGFYRAISQLVLRLVSRAGRPGGAFLFGMANGLLPCGMVYMAAVTAISYGSIVYAGLFMLFFGLGTLPAMLVMVVAGRRFLGARQHLLRRVTPVVITTVGLLLLLRGLNLNIPYLSPAFGRLTQEIISCHF